MTTPLATPDKSACHDKFACHLLNRLGMMGKFPVASQCMRTRSASAALDKCLPERSASFMASQFLAVCLETRQCFASADIDTPFVSMASRRRDPKVIHKYCRAQSFRARRNVTPRNAEFHDAVFHGQKIYHFVRFGCPSPISPPRANHPGTLLRAVARGFPERELAAQGFYFRRELTGGGCASLNGWPGNQGTREFLLRRNAGVTVGHLTAGKVRHEYPQRAVKRNDGIDSSAEPNGMPTPRRFDGLENLEEVIAKPVTFNGESGCRITRCDFPVRPVAVFAHSKR